jgi:NAD(P)-dependent dehydrogenase (short-subunit alcohol dehydrogenase family)
MRCPGDAATLETSASGRIVNVSSGLGSLTQIGDSTSEFAVFIFIGYGASKAALNMLTVQAAELKDSGIKVNSAHPGCTATDLNGHRGRHTIPEGVTAAIRLASSARRWSHRRLLWRGPSAAAVGHECVAASGPGSVILVKRSRMMVRAASRASCPATSCALCKSSVAMGCSRPKARHEQSRCILNWCVSGS